MGARLASLNENSPGLACRPGVKGVALSLLPAHTSGMVHWNRYPQEQPWLGPAPLACRPALATGHQTLVRAVL